MSRTPISPPALQRCFQLLTLTKVCSVGLMPFRVSLQSPGERALLTYFHRISPFFVRAAAAGSEQEVGQVGTCEGQEELPAAVPLAVLQRRAAIMFSGDTGAVVASGEGLGTSAPSYGLVKDVVNVVEALPEALFDRHAEHRPCGLLDRRGAVGMLIGDVLGLPLLPWVLAEPVGKAAYKLPDKIPGEIKNAKKAAKRKGSDTEAAVATVLRSLVKLPLLSTDDITVAAKRTAKVAPPPPLALPPQPPPPAPPPPSKPIAVYSMHEYTDDVAPPAGYVPPPIPPPPPSARRQLRRMFGSREAAEAIYQCREIEIAQDSLARDLCRAQAERFVNVIWTHVARG